MGFEEARLAIELALLVKSYLDRTTLESASAPTA